MGGSICQENVQLSLKSYTAQGVHTGVSGKCMYVHMSMYMDMYVHTCVSVYVCLHACVPVHTLRQGHLEQAASLWPRCPVTWG